MKNLIVVFIMFVFIKISTVESAQFENPGFTIGNKLTALSILIGLVELRQCMKEISVANVQKRKKGLPLESLIFPFETMQSKAAQVQPEMKIPKLPFYPPLFGMSPYSLPPPQFPPQFSPLSPPRPAPPMESSPNRIEQTEKPVPRQEPFDPSAYNEMPMPYYFGDNPPIKAGEKLYPVKKSPPPPPPYLGHFLKSMWGYPDGQ